MRKPGRIKNMKKIHAEAREVLQHGVGNSVDVGKKEKVRGNRKKFTTGEKSAKEE